MDKRWSFYWRALELGDFSGWDSERAPFPGFWRVRYSAKLPWMPCATWDPGKGLLRGKAASPLMLWSTLMCWREPVTEEAYKHALAHGTWWDTLTASATEPNAGRPVVDVAKAAPILPPPRGRKR